MDLDRKDQIEKIETELFLEAIYRLYGFDFRNYAFESIKRRIWYSARETKAKTISEFQGQVLYQPELIKNLTNNFSITVTEMFRDPSFFEAFRLKLVPLLKQHQTIRILVAGCASGEEVYSLAILLSEEGLYEQTSIYATDINEEILERAKQGKIALTHMKHYTRNYLQAGGQKEFSKYYRVEGENAYLHDFLKKNLVFAHHNLATDHSFNEFHIILCRNVLIYFNKELKERAFTLFYDSLREDGILCLGSQESIFSTNAFTDFDYTNKIYKKNEDIDLELN
ncbi:protein-glutamate O-methyltransferase CheR [Anaerobacillus alkaliphilus]|uniref:Protein-glutamate O-methyltransferase CheR n=1 Tax=Anaerobacillus alkaliphilus TaxID=1548597 RepID=A0A4Q0VP90_9BACI|nr:protein-glutamate O-methyltransferase CheR [Anaerobacillus alkaliphilus]RXI98193.1 protein-glutamate O-methyltransferase CheR [Anaerobacillus alkaliphilus]